MTEAQRKEREAELFQLKFDEGILLSKRVLRVQPIGTDRNHNRYWVFSDGTPGLYVEKGTTPPPAPIAGLPFHYCDTGLLVACVEC